MALKNVFSVKEAYADVVPVINTTIYVGSLYEVTNGAPTKHIFLGAQRIASIEHRGTSIETSYFHTNHLGSTDTITDDSGNKKVHYEYEPYGQVVQTDGTDSTDYKFTGKPLDDETGLYYYGARYYNPLIGRFITPDTIIQDPTNPQSLNRYSYCGNNPVNRIDPTGHSWWSKFWKSFGSTVLSIVGVVLAPFTGGLSLYLTWGATIWSGVQAAQAGQFGAWAAGFAISMALGGILPVGDFANPLMQIGAGALRGAAIGALSGGIASVIGGGSFGAGAAYGAMGGAEGGAISGFYSTQQFKNWQAGNGFRSNADVRNENRRLENMRASLESTGHSKLSGGADTSKILWQRANDPNMLMGGWPDTIRDRLSQVNWKTVGIGALTAVAGASTVAGGIAAGTATTTATGGLGAAYALISAGTAITTGMTLFAVGVSDVVLGIYGNESVLIPTLKAIYNTPPEATAVDYLH